MRACASTSGGVIFIPDEIERTTAKKSYKNLVEEPKEKKPKKGLLGLFGRRKKSEKKLREAA